MEDRGWIYYKTKSEGSGAGNALMELNALMNPTAKKVLERELEQSKEESSKVGDNSKD